jgi:hypothetical protein
MPAWVSKDGKLSPRLDELLVRNTLSTNAKIAVARGDIGRESSKWVFREGGISTIKTLSNKKNFLPQRSDFGAVKTE